LVLLAGADWLVPLFVFLLLPVVVLSGATFYATSALRRANRLFPGRTAGPTRPPLRWLWSPGPAAMLHRRLKAACQLAGPVAELTPTRPATPWSAWWRRSSTRVRYDAVAELAREVLDEAAQLDRQVVAAGYLPRGLLRARALGGLDDQVRTLEDAARRVHELAVRRGSLVQSGGTGPLSLDQRIAAMEAALTELGASTEPSGD
jgi:hypothetical protein